MLPLMITYSMYLLVNITIGEADCRMTMGLAKTARNARHQLGGWTVRLG
jgi:hypothetical protein